MERRWLTLEELLHNLPLKKSRVYYLIGRMFRWGEEPAWRPASHAGTVVRLGASRGGRHELVNIMNFSAGPVL